VQIYCDVSGDTDLAIGLALLASASFRETSTRTYAAGLSKLLEAAGT